MLPIENVKNRYLIQHALKTMHLSGVQILGTNNKGWKNRQCQVRKAYTLIEMVRCFDTDPPIAYGGKVQVR
jgi:hypothetical protein